MPDAHGVMNHQEILYHYLGGSDEDKVAAAQAAVEGGASLGSAGTRLAYNRVAAPTAVQFSIFGSVVFETDTFVWEDGMQARAYTGDFLFGSVAAEGNRYSLVVRKNGVLEASPFLSPPATEAVWNGTFLTSRSPRMAATLPEYVEGDVISVALLGLCAGASDDVTMQSASCSPWIMVKPL